MLDEALVRDYVSCGFPEYMSVFRQERDGYCKEQRPLGLICPLTIEFNLIAVGGRSDAEQVTDEYCLYPVLEGISRPHV